MHGRRSTAYFAAFPAIWVVANTTPGERGTHTHTQTHTLARSLTARTRTRRVQSPAPVMRLTVLDRGILQRTRQSQHCAVRVHSAYCASELRALRICLNASAGQMHFLLLAPKPRMKHVLIPSWRLSCNRNAIVCALQRHIHGFAHQMDV